ncbi:branched chain amino acid ABC transporter substrate-binding protein [Ochrobactrum sp. P6BS-III]|uniref:branched-chain amino acid ABC transporter substrate-binding protein n=1 Tax=unclassified Ochrobactrum TaxID=239106 RepID=UPI000992B9F9|nr:branched-chain amino acid transport system substrate-binding protein [Ochrobactrum sp. P6BSIII]OOL14638.1 branched chain amino acid ABC transporter substrate-binding protein [Ochrobactrum sp. P6BS-III]
MKAYKKFLVATIAAVGVTSTAHADIVIGAAGPLTNAESIFGVTWMNGMEIAIRQVNEAGGIHGEKVVLQRDDDNADPKQGTLIAQKHCDNAAMMGVVANFNSGVTIPSSDVYHRCDLPQVTNASNPKVTQSGYKNLFRPIANDLSQGSAPADYAVKTLKAKAAAVVHDKQAFGQGVAEVFRDTFTKDGGKVTSFSGVTQTDVDFSALLTSIRSENPDVIYFGGVMPAVGLFVKQAREFGIKATIFAADSAFAPDFINGAGAENAEGAIVSFQAPPYDSSPELEAFAKSYKDAFGEDAGPYSAYGYVEASVILEAMKKLPAPLSRKAISEEIAKTNLKTMVGTVSFKPDGELNTPFIFLYKVEGGKFALVK